MYSGTDPESYITEYTLVYEDQNECWFAPAEREFFIDNLLVHIHSIVEMIFVHRPYAM